MTKKKVKKTPEEILESKVTDELLGSAMPLDSATDVEVIQGFLVGLAKRMESLEAKFDSLNAMIVAFHSVPERNATQGHKVSSKSS